MNRHEPKVPKEPTGREFLNELWEDMTGKVFKQPKVLPAFQNLQESEWCYEFEKLMKDRLIQGAFRYGLIAERDYSNYDLIGEVIKRLGRYKDDKNLEYLVDSANFLLLEFIHASRHGAKLKALNDSEHCKPVNCDYCGRPKSNKSGQDMVKIHEECFHGLVNDAFII